MKIKILINQNNLIKFNYKNIKVIKIQFNTRKKELRHNIMEMFCTTCFENIAEVF